jgi:O-antigen biosynthesis protein
MNETSPHPRLRVPPVPKRTAGELATTIAKRGTAAVAAIASTGISAARGLIMGSAARRQFRELPRPVRLCLGSGHAPIPGWVNVDFEPPADILVDLRYGLPIETGTVDAIYSEHLVEHLALDAAQRMFAEWRRVLAPSGVVRIATPDLERLITDYRGDWRTRHDWINWPEYAHIDTPVRMINVAMRDWGHQYLYDFEELALRLREAGFGDVRRLPLGESDDPALRDLETRADSSLVVEARS